MKRSNRELAKESAILQKARERACRLRDEQLALEKTYKVNSALEKHNQKKSKSILESFNIKPTNFWTYIEENAPKLIDSQYIKQLHILNVLDHQRQLEDWVPKGKGKSTIFDSLCDHLLAKYSTPKFIWSAFWEHEVEFVDLKKQDISGKYIDIECSPILQAVIRISRGDSFAKMCKAGDFPIKFTNKQCHQFLSSNSDCSFMYAVRRTQIQTHGGNVRLLNALISRDNGKKLSGIADEEFLDSVIAWFCKNPMLDLDQMGPLMDFIWQKRRADKNFSMKGRSPIALMRSMQEWHNDLAKRNIYGDKKYKESGLKQGTFEVNHRESSGNYIKSLYEITEILSSKELQAEGRELHHCVLSYSGSIENGICSIWSLKLNGDRAITLEVRNRTLVQARGKFNRQINAEEFKIIQKWAQQNSLAIQISSW